MRIESGRRTDEPEDAAANGSKKSPRFGRVREVAEAWAASRPEKVYRQVAGYLIRAAGELEPRQLTSPIILGIQADWRRRLARNTTHAYTGHLRALLRTMHEAGAPKIDVPKAPASKGREVIAKPEEIDRMLSIAPPHMRLFILLCWQTALRYSEALAVTPRSVNKETQTATIQVKGGKKRTIPIPPQIWEMLTATMHGDPDQSCVSILRGSPKPIGPGGIRSAWYRITKQLNLTHINPHDLRRTTATALYRNSEHDIRAVQQYLGHDNMTSTLRYLAPLEQQELAEMHRLLNFHVKGPIQ